jgi:polar amino acid transport system permease protein
MPAGSKVNRRAFCFYDRAMDRLIKNFLEFMPILLKGTVYTVEITVAAIILSTVLGFILSLALVSDRVWIYRPVRLWINFIRGVPLLVQMFYVYFVMPDIGIRLNAMEAGIFALSVCYSSYHAETFRAGILSIPKGQWESAKSIGLRYWQIMTRIILPQAARVILPPIGTSYIILLKDSSLASVITVRELTRSGQLIATSTFENMQVFTMVALIYVTLTQLLAFFIQMGERKFRIS